MRRTGLPNNAPGSTGHLSQHEDRLARLMPMGQGPDKRLTSDEIERHTYRRLEVWTQASGTLRMEQHHSGPAEMTTVPNKYARKRRGLEMIEQATGPTATRCDFTFLHHELGPRGRNDPRPHSTRQGFDTLSARWQAYFSKA
jgi:hypothetical protein